MTNIRKILTIAFLAVVVMLMWMVVEPKKISKESEWAKGKITSEEGKYDVIVVGSDPEGIAAAISAAKSGDAKILLTGEEKGPGGLFTYGWLNTIDMSVNGSNILTKGIFLDFYNRIGNTESFDVKQAEQAFLDMISEHENIEYMPNTKFKKAIVNNNIIEGVVVEKEGVETTYYGKRIIDATRDGDVCADAGVPYFVGMEDVNIKDKMAVTLVFKIAGVDWTELGQDVNKYIETYEKDLVHKSSGINESTAWGFGKLCYDKYTPIHPNMKLRGLNMGKQNDGTILINALQIFDVDGLDKSSMDKAKVDGKAECENIIKHLKSLGKSFENAYLVDVAEDLYVRETRHIKGEYTLMATDLLENTNFWDKVGMGSYPIDIQSTSVNNTGFVIASPKQYSIPYRCIIPLNIDNLFVVGKAASYSSVAAGSARTVPTGMTLGEAAGVAAIYSLIEDRIPRSFINDKKAIEKIQRIIVNQGGYLPEFSIKDKNQDYAEYEKIKEYINLGLLSGGYNNEFGFNKEANMANFTMGVVNLLQRGRSEHYSEELKNRMMKYFNESEGVTWEKAQKFTKEIFYIELGNISTMPTDINKVLTRGEMYSLIIDIVNGYTSKSLVSYTI